MKVGWEGKTLHFVSMYVPVQPAKRKVFLSKLFMGKRAIVMGDFNCVENVQLDVRHAAGSNTVYENAHSVPLRTHVVTLGDSPAACSNSGECP